MRTAVLALFALVACAPASETTSSSQSTTPETVAKTTRPVIATLQTQDKKVSILGGTKDGELRVMVRDLDGKLLADGVTVDELSRTDPMLGALIQSAFASNGTTYLDATL